MVAHLFTSAASRAIDRNAAAAIVQRVTERGFKVALIGAAAERPTLDALATHVNAKVYAGRSIAEIAELLARARLFVGLDSSMMNLSDAIGTPSVIVYPRTAPAVAGPFHTFTHAVVPDEYEPAGVETVTSWRETKSAKIATSTILAQIEAALPAMTQP
ncbi:MAG: hypothetical protein JO165_09700 [Candidatus Eremiobacteraeota bacterium]|nr:hypothetical protein [Candidatus Eremiobacteraeota bacterium]